MIYYYHVYNKTEYDKPYSIHIIDAPLATANLAVYVNGTFIKYVAPNMLKTGTGSLSYSKHFEPAIDFLDTLHSGTVITYADQGIDKAIFNDNTYIHVKNSEGKYLYRTPGTIDYYEWSLTNKSKFFFNPYFWDSEYLWKKTVGYVPSGINLTNQWPTDYEIAFFSKRTFTVTDTWVGSQQLNTVEPSSIDYFLDNVSGQNVTFQLSHLIELDLVPGDKVLLTNGVERKEFIYQPVGNSIIKIDGVTMPGTLNYPSKTRPVEHLEILTINPNRKILFSKSLANGSNNFNIVLDAISYPVSMTTSANPTDLVMNDLVPIYDSNYTHIVEGY